MTHRHVVTLGGLLTTLGIAVAATAPVLGTAGSGRTRPQEMLGGLLVVVGWAILAWGLHRYGRADH